MTTAHRPTFDTAKGNEQAPTRIYHARMLPAHTQLKMRKPGQGGDVDQVQNQDLRAKLLQAEAQHFNSNTEGGASRQETDGDDKRQRLLEALEKEKEESSSEDEDDSEEEDSSEEEEESSDDEDETALLLKELEKIKQERAKEKEAELAKQQQDQQEEREKEIALGNPLLQDMQIKRRWDDDVIFKHQARNSNNSKKPRFINDMIRSDFHRKFMDKYIR